MSAVTAFAIVAFAGVALVIVGALIDAFFPDLGRRRRRDRALDDELGNALARFSRAFVWAFKKGLTGLFSVIGSRDRGAGQKLMAVGMGLLFLGLLGLLLSVIVDALDGDDGAGGTATTPTGTTTTPAGATTTAP